MTGPRELRPCGTRAAYKRHRRNGEPACADCRKAESRAEVRRAKARRAMSRPPREREIRDPAVPYRYRARTYPWAVRVLAASEATWGKPRDEEAA